MTAHFPRINEIRALIDRAYNVINKVRCAIIDKEPLRELLNSPRLTLRGDPA